MRRLYSYNPNAGGGGPPADGSVTSAKLGGDITNAGKALLVGANASAQRSTLGLGRGATASISTGTATVTITPAVYGVATAVVSDADAAVGRVCLASLVPNTDYDADDLDGFTVIGACGDGSVTLTVQRVGPIVGTLTLAYLITGA